MRKNKKKLKWILAAVALIACIVLVVVSVKSCKSKAKELTEENEKEPIKDATIEPGTYFSQYQLSCVQINEDGTAKYYPDSVSVYAFEGTYTINNNVLTLQQREDYWKFKIIKGELHLVQTKTGGVVVDCREKEEIFTLTEKKPGLIVGSSYRADNNMILYYGEDNVRLYKHEGALACMEREFTFEDNILKFGKDSDLITFLFKDDKFYLQDSWIDGVFYEFSKENVEFVSVFNFTTDVEEDDDTKYNVIVEDQYVEAEGGLNPGYYYNSDKSVELMIKEDGVAQFFTDTKSSKCIEGKYECLDGEMILMQLFRDDYYDWSNGNWCIAVEDYFFTIGDDQLILTKYLDKYGNFTTYEESERIVLTYSEKPLINDIRPGTYSYRYDYDDYYYSLDLCFDNVGNVSVSYYSYKYEYEEDYTGSVIDDEAYNGDIYYEEPIVSEIISDENMFMGKYVIDNDIVKITLSNGKELTGMLVDGCVVISDIKNMDEDCLISDEMECEYKGSLLEYYFY